MADPADPTDHGWHTSTSTGRGQATFHGLVREMPVSSQFARAGYVKTARLPPGPCAPWYSTATTR